MKVTGVPVKAIELLKLRLIIGAAVVGTAIPKVARTIVARRLRIDAKDPEIYYDLHSILKSGFPAW